MVNCTKEEWLIGLDNGICVRRNEYTESISELKQFEEDWDKKYGYDFEIAYFRKCWNIKSMIFCSDIKGIRYNGRSDPLSKDDIDIIINGLRSFNEDNWDEDGGSIWEWHGEDNYSEYVQRQINNLKMLYHLMEKYDLEVYFYDSY